MWRLCLLLCLPLVVSESSKLQAYPTYQVQAHPLITRESPLHATVLKRIRELKRCEFVRFQGDPNPNPNPNPKP